MTVQVHVDMNDMHQKFGVHQAVDKMDPDILKRFLDFRFNFLKEELEEGLHAVQTGNPEEIVDALIDLTVIAVGTLDLFDVDFEKAWNSVLDANMSKEVGVKPGRPNPFNVPDLCKPQNWQAPDHSGNHGLLTKVNYDL